MGEIDTPWIRRPATICHYMCLALTLVFSHKIRIDFRFRDSPEKPVHTPRTLFHPNKSRWVAWTRVERNSTRFFFRKSSWADSTWMFFWWKSVESAQPWLDFQGENSPESSDLPLPNTRRTRFPGGNLVEPGLDWINSKKWPKTDGIRMDHGRAPSVKIALTETNFKLNTNL